MSLNLQNISVHTHLKEFPTMPNQLTDIIFEFFLVYHLNNICCHVPFSIMYFAGAVEKIVIIKMFKNLFYLSQWRENPKKFHMQ